MPDINVYSNVGKYRHNSNDVHNSNNPIFKFDKGSIEILHIRQFRIEESIREFKVFRSQKRKRTSLENMDGKYIMFVVIKYCPWDDSGSVTLYSKKHYYKIKYVNMNDRRYTFFTICPSEKLLTEDNDSFTSDSD